jgi:hypothetical protein
MYEMLRRAASRGLCTKTETAFQLRSTVENTVQKFQKTQKRILWKSCFCARRKWWILPEFQIPWPRSMTMVSNFANVEASRVLCHHFLLFDILPTPWQS